MTNLQVIKQQEVLGKTLTVYGTIEEPLMLAKDVAEWIDYSWTNSKKTARKTGQMLATVDDDEKLKATIQPLQCSIQKAHGGVRENTEMWFLTEKGLYQVLVNSRKAVAKELLEALDLGYKIKYKKTPLQTGFTFMLSHFLQEHVKSYAVDEYNPTFVEEFRLGKYRLDYFFSDYGIIVEYDEKAHKYKVEEDESREQEIKKILGNEVKFIRVQEGKEFEGVIHIISELSRKFHESKSN